MTKTIGSIAAAALALAFAGATASSAAEPPTSGTVSIETKDAAELGPSAPTFVKAVGEAFETRGFTVLEEPGHAALVAELSVSRVEVGTGTAKVATSGSDVVPGGAPNAVGVGVRIPLPTGKSALVPLQRTRLEIRIHKRGEQSTLWQGAAITVRAAGTRNGGDATVAADLSAALLRAYPAQPEDVIGVP